MSSNVTRPSTGSGAVRAPFELPAKTDAEIRQIADGLADEIIARRCLGPGPETLDQACHPLSVDAYRELCNEPLLPSLEAKRELLDAAFVLTLGELGVPENDAGWDLFHARTDALYRLSLLARRPMRGEAVEWRIRATLMTLRASAL